MGKEFTDEGLGKTPIIEPMERTVYPDGISEDQKENILNRERELLEGSYLVNSFDNMPYNLRVKLNISFTEKEEIVIDISNYPSKPWIILDDHTQDDLGKNVGEVLYFLKTWDVKRPPHIIEIIKELEAVLMTLRLDDKTYPEKEKIPSDPEEAPKFDPKAIFIIDKQKKMLIFLDKLTKRAPVGQEEISQVISTINSEVKNFELYSYNKLQMSEGFTYFFVNFKRLIIIILCKGKESPPHVLFAKMNGAFMKKYADFLDDYSRSDVVAFKPFYSNIRQYLETYLYEEAEVKEIQVIEFEEDIEFPEPEVSQPEVKSKDLVKVVKEPKKDIEPEVKPEPKPIVPEDKSEKMMKILEKTRQDMKVEKTVRPKKAAAWRSAESVIFDEEANDIQKIDGFCLKFVDYKDFYRKAMENWSLPEADPDKIVKTEKKIKKRLAISKKIRALYISDNQLDSSIYKLWIKVGNFNEFKPKENLKYDYVAFIESNIDEKLTQLCWTNDSKKFIVLREINDDPLQLKHLFKTTDHVKDWSIFPS
jgi:hypothetical protein